MQREVIPSASATSSGHNDEIGPVRSPPGRVSSLGRFGSPVRVCLLSLSSPPVWLQQGQDRFKVSGLSSRAAN